jgi:RNA polymerase sigma factor
MPVAAVKRDWARPPEEMAWLAQQGDRQMEDLLLRKYQPFIKKTVSKVCKRYIDHKDDEFSIGLLAFHDSMMKYDRTKGASLLSFAEVIIRRRVIDYIRQAAKHQAASLDWNSREDEEKAGTCRIEYSISLKKYREIREEENRRAELDRFQSALHTYGIRIHELIRQAPKHRDAKLHALQVAEMLIQEPGFMAYLKNKHRLPLKKLERKVNVSRKTLERNRKYIIAVVLILNGDYDFLREYVRL